MSPSNGGGRIHMPRLLIVDDEKSLCQMLEIAFRKGGFSVETVSSGALAQRKMNSQHYDVVVSDIRMPDLTGIELLEYAKKIGQPRFHVPFEDLQLLDFA